MADVAVVAPQVVPSEDPMYDEEEAQDVVDARPTQPPPDSASRCGLSFPWAFLLVGLIVSAVMMAAVAVSTVPLSMATGR